MVRVIVRVRVIVAVLMAMRLPGKDVGGIALNEQHHADDDDDDARGHAGPKRHLRFCELFTRIERDDAEQQDAPYVREGDDNPQREGVPDGAAFADEVGCHDRFAMTW